MRSLVPLLALTLVVGAVGCSSRSASRELKVRISGSPDVAFMGSCMLLTDQGRYEHKLDAKPPFELDLVGSEVSCYVQRLGAPGRLAIEIRVDGELRGFDASQADYGSVNARSGT